MGSTNIAGCLALGDVSVLASEGDTLSKQATTPLKPSSGITLDLGSGNPGDDSDPNLSCLALLHSSAFNVGLSFPLHCGCNAFPSSHWEAEGFLWQRLLTGQDAVPLSSQGNHLGEPLPFPCPQATQGEYLALLVAHW